MLLALAGGAVAVIIGKETFGLLRGLVAYSEPKAPFVGSRLALV